MSLIWVCQILLDIVFVAALAKFFLVRTRRISIDQLERGLGLVRDRVNTPLGSPLSTLAEKRAPRFADPSVSSRIEPELSEDSALFSKAQGIRVREAKRLLNQGVSLQEVSRKTGLSQAELSLLEKTILGGLKDLS